MKYKMIAVIVPAISTRLTVVFKIDFCGDVMLKNSYFSLIDLWLVSIPARSQASLLPGKSF
jgi:hypothetical protein